MIRTGRERIHRSTPSLAQGRPKDLHYTFGTVALNVRFLIIWYSNSRGCLTMRLLSLETADPIIAFLQYCSNAITTVAAQEASLRDRVLGFNQRNPKAPNFAFSCCITAIPVIITSSRSLLFTSLSKNSSFPMLVPDAVELNLAIGSKYESSKI